MLPCPCRVRPGLFGGRGLDDRIFLRQIRKTNGVRKTKRYKDAMESLKFRMRLSSAEKKALAFRMPFWPYGSWIALSFLALAASLMAYFSDTRVALIIGPAWLALLTVLYFGLRLYITPGAETGYPILAGDRWAPSPVGETSRPPS